MVVIAATKSTLQTKVSCWGWKTKTLTVSATTAQHVSSQCILNRTVLKRLTVQVDAGVAGLSFI